MNKEEENKMLDLCEECGEGEECCCKLCADCKLLVEYCCCDILPPKFLHETLS